MPAKLEELNKTYGTPNLISEVRLVERFRAENLGEFFREIHIGPFLFGKIMRTIVGKSHGKIMRIYGTLP